jgi:hypothetical protein
MLLLRFNCSHRDMLWNVRLCQSNIGDRVLETNNQHDTILSEFNPLDFHGSRTIYSIVLLSSLLI